MLWVLSCRLLLVSNSCANGGRRFITDSVVSVRLFIKISLIWIVFSSFLTTCKQIHFLSRLSVLCLILDLFDTRRRLPLYPLRAICRTPIARKQSHITALGCLRPLFLKARLFSWRFQNPEYLLAHLGWNYQCILIIDYHGSGVVMHERLVYNNGTVSVCLIFFEIW